MPVISIQRDTNSNVCFVRIMSTDNLATIAQANYIADNQDAINALNGGVFGWYSSDMLLVAASDGNALFQFTDDTFDSLIIYGEQGSGVIHSGLINQLAYYSANGANISGLATANNGVLITSAGGVPSISSALPSAVQLNITSVGTLNSGTWNATRITVPFGGTGNTTFAAYSVICAGTTATGAFQNVSGVGNAGEILTSNGAGLLPTWQGNPASGTVSTGNQNDLSYYSASPSGKVLSPIAGATSSVLITSGLGVPTLSQTLPSLLNIPQPNIVGVTNGGNAAAGSLGQFISSTIAQGSAVSIIRNTATNVTSISLTAGDWDVYGNVSIVAVNATTTGLLAWISDVSETLPDFSVTCGPNNVAAVLQAGCGANAPFRRYSLSSTTTIYLGAYFSDSANNGTVCGGIYARRIR